MSASARGSRTRSKQPNGVSQSVSEDDDMSFVTDNPTTKSAVTSPVSEKAPLAGPTPRQPLVSHGFDQIEPHFHTEQQTPLRYPDSLNSVIAASQDEDRNIDAGRSSSLSDIGDAPDGDDGILGLRDFSKASNGTDSEAETERLEASPQKSRKNLRVLLKHQEPSPDNEFTKVSTQIILEAKDREGVEAVVAPSSRHDPNSLTVTANQAGEGTSILKVSSLGDATGATPRVASPPEVAGTKRKRTVSISRSQSGDAVAEALARKQTGSVDSDFDSHPPITDRVGARIESQSARIVRDDSLIGQDWTEDGESVVQDVEASTFEVVLPEEDPCLTKRSVKVTKGRRKVKKLRPEKSGDVESVDAMEDEAANTERNFVLSVGENIETGEDLVDVEGEEEGTEAALRSEEELTKKNSALESLSAIEKQFATFKDKLYHERLAQLNAELELLNQPNPTQPEYLAMVQCIDTRLIEKVNHEQTLLAYKLEALEVKSVAERSQLLSQYFQEARDIRERKLDEVGEQWYQIQRDRRSWDGSVPDVMFKFPTRRSQQITQQTAYNMEVSILSGLAKYVGFPAAPSIQGARLGEIEDDLKCIGIKPLPLPPLSLHHPPPLSTAISRVAHHKTRPAAEEQFLEQTPWANPQHPAHNHIQHMQRLAQQQPRTSSPSRMSSGLKSTQIPDSGIEPSMAVGASTPTTFSFDIQNLVNPGQLYSRSSDEKDGLRASSVTKFGVLDAGAKGYFMSDQQDLHAPPSIIYSASQTPIERSTRLVAESVGALNQPQPINASPVLPGTTGKAITSKLHVATPRIGISGNTSHAEGLAIDMTDEGEERTERLRVTRYHLHGRTTSKEV